MTFTALMKNETKRTEIQAHKSKPSIILEHFSFVVLL